jgi:DNA-binding XRE family transcriptional regulator
MNDSAMIEVLKRLAAEPDVLEELAGAVARAGAWRSWTFDRRVWFLRRRRRLTQAELSRRSGVSQRRISRIEAGDDVKLSTVRTLWRALGYEPLVVPDALDLARMPRPYRKGRTMPPKTSSPSPPK